MNDEYAEWKKIKFKVYKEENTYRIVSVDFGAIPIAIVSSVSLGIKEAKMKALRKLNEYNSKPRWTSNTVGDSDKLLKKVKKDSRGRKRTTYQFYRNSYTDLEFIEHETTTIKQKTKETKISNTEL